MSMHYESAAKTRTRLIYQFVHKIEDYSSQYGCKNSISYVADNLIGKPYSFPHVGDSPRAYNLKTYGNWWKEKKQFEPSFSPLNSPSVEFVDVSFDTPVWPHCISIYETFNTGSVVKVWGSLNGKNWHLLWSGKPRVTRDEVTPLPIFKPNLARTWKYINYLRMEMDTSQLDYYPSFDAILLVGSPKCTKDLLPHPFLHHNLPSPNEFYSQ